MRKNAILFLLTIILFLCTVEIVFSQTDGGAPSAPGIGAPKPGTFPPPNDKAEPPREPITQTYIRKSIRDLAPLYLMEKNGEL
ncbi:MAG: hypothetical protein IKW80_03190, partial [Thermoguttaceae bacterium]|nr:hypothetical protein [Thermoguttaceae bacterium]